MPRAAMTGKGRKTCGSDLFSKRRSISLLRPVHEVPSTVMRYDTSHPESEPTISNTLRTAYVSYNNFIAFQPKIFYAPRKRELFPHQLWSCVTECYFFGYHSKRLCLHTRSRSFFFRGWCEWDSPGSLSRRQNWPVAWGGLGTESFFLEFGWVWSTI